MAFSVIPDFLIVWMAIPPRPPNDELQRTRDGKAAASPLNSVLGGRPELNQKRAV
jgi:hypothetical protein